MNSLRNLSSPFYIWMIYREECQIKTWKREKGASERERAFANGKYAGRKREWICVSKRETFFRPMWSRRQFVLTIPLINEPIATYPIRQWPWKETKEKKCQPQIHRNVVCVKFDKCILKETRGINWTYPIEVFNNLFCELLGFCRNKISSHQGQRFFFLLQQVRKQHVLILFHLNN